MDGNGRWAKQHKRPRSFGHKKGGEALKGLLKPCADIGIEVLSVYAFSHENWQRSQEEVNDLMGLLQLYLDKELDNLIEHRVALMISGDMTRFPAKTRRQLDHAIEATKEGDQLTLNICLSYGARQEILRACQALCASGERVIDEKMLEKQLYTAQLPELDLLIRTGGELRLSNFLLWQAAYAELYFTDILWPDFDEAALRAACEAYGMRERRYGRR